jgi:hypothetical protein
MRQPSLTMQTDPSEIQKLTERVEALEKFKEEVKNRYLIWLAGLGMLTVCLLVLKK